MMRNNWVVLSTLCLLPLVTACGGGGEDGGNGGGDSFAGQTYLLQISPGDFGPGIGQELSREAVPEFALTIGGTPDAYTVMIGTGQTPEDGSAWQQELCSPTSQLTASPAAYPAFSLGPVELPIYLRHPSQDASARATAHQFTLTNVLLPDGVTEGSGTMSAVLDAREIYPVFPQLGIGADADTLCSHVANNNIDTCKPCPGTPDMATYCLNFSAGYLGAIAAPIALQETPGYADTCFFE